MIAVFILQRSPGILAYYSASPDQSGVHSVPLSHSHWAAGWATPICSQDVCRGPLRDTPTGPGETSCEVTRVMMLPEGATLASPDTERVQGAGPGEGRATAWAQAPPPDTPTPPTGWGMIIVWNSDQLENWMRDGKTSHYAARYLIRPSQSASAYLNISSISQSETLK